MDLRSDAHGPKSAPLRCSLRLVFGAAHDDFWRPWAGRLCAWSLLIVALAACGETFKPASHVDRLRILAIRADVPEVATPMRDSSGAVLSPQPEGHPVDRSRIRSLVADPLGPEDPSREITVLYVACTPDPTRPATAESCTSYAVLQDPSALASLLGSGSGGGGGSSCGGGEAPATAGSAVSFLGAESCRHGAGCVPVSITIGDTPLELPPPTYVVPDDLDLASLPAGTPARILGLQATVVAIALAATADELLQGADPADPCSIGSTLSSRLVELLGSRENLTAVKRLQIRGPDAADAPNLNPAISGIDAGKISFPAELDDPVQAEALVRRKWEYQLRATIPGDAGDLVQRFTRYDVLAQKLGDEEERWLYSWFSTAGNLDGLRRREADDPIRWLTPTGKKDDPVPENGRVFLYAVVRDLRGGVDWVVREVRLVDP